MPKRILIADDEPVQRRLLEAAVTRMGFEPVIADGGAAALAALDAGTQAAISVVILDLVMPDIDHLLASYPYGGHAITAAIWNDNIVGYQFHPEKSGETGLNIIRQMLSGWL